ncbi:MAG: hypothetical protein ACOCQI_06730 [Desulfosalsimonas sp.]
MDKENINVECPDCGYLCKFGDMVEQNQVRSTQCPDCKTEFLMKDSFLKPVALNPRVTWVLGIRTRPKNLKSSQDNAGDSSEKGSAVDADALVRDAQRREGTTNKGDEPPENPLIADAKRKAADAGKRENKGNENPLMADARKRAGAQSH